MPRLDSMADDLRKQIAALLREKKAIEDSITLIKPQYDEILSTKFEVLDEVKSLEQKRQSLEDAISTDEGEIGKLKASLNEQIHQNSLQASYLSKERKKCDALADDLDAQKKIYFKLVGELNTEKITFAGTMNAREKELSDYEKKLIALRSDLDRRETSLDNTEASLNERRFDLEMDINKFYVDKSQFTDDKARFDLEKTKSEEIINLIKDTINIAEQRMKELAITQANIEVREANLQKQMTDVNNLRCEVDARKKELSLQDSMVDKIDKIIHRG